MKRYIKVEIQIFNLQSVDIILDSTKESFLQGGDNMISNSDF